MTIDPAAPPEIQSLIGLNTNLTVHDKVLHVQTEDLGRHRASIVTHVFSKDGQVVHKVRFDYSKHLSHPNLTSILPKAMQAQHLAVMQRLRQESGDGGSSHISQIDLPCVPDDTRTPSPDFLSPAPKTVRAHLDAGAWDRLVAQAKNERKRERAAMPVIPLPDPTSQPMLMTPNPERVSRTPGPSSSCWDEAVAKARREYEKTPPPEPLSENELAARRAYDQAMACLHQDNDEGALVLLCKAVSLEPKNPMFRARLARVLSRLGTG